MRKPVYYIDAQKKRIARSPLAKRLIDGISWTLVGNIIGKFLQLLAFIFVARILGKEAYGQVGIVRSTLMMFLIFSSAGMGITATRYIARYRNSNPHNAYLVYNFTQKTVFWVGLIFSLLVFLSSSFIAEKQLNSVQLSDALKIGAVTLFFMTLSSVQTGSLNGFERFKKLGINTAINGFIQLVSVVLGAYLWGINGVVLGLGIASLVLIVQLHFALRDDIHRCKNTFKSLETEKFNAKSVFIQFSLPAILQSLVYIPVLWWAKTYLINQSNYSEMAIFDVAEQWYYVVLFIPTSLSSIVLPLLTNVNYSSSGNQYNKLLKFNLWLNIGISVVAALAVALFAPIIYKFYGTEFTDFRPLLVLLITVVVSAANNVFGQVIASKGIMWIGFMVNLLWAIWLILFSIIFIGNMQKGAVGLAYALLISYLLHSIAQGFVALRLKLVKN
ncbi:MAG: oligosaccharide flippase family protein [Bacteroidales bacterium]|nr:oligosaccharide flippase family protein [Bacteroidales bacterium]